MTFWTETAIAQHLDGRFYQLQQKSLGTVTVVDLNEPEVVEDDKSQPIARWTEQELVYLIELKRQGKTHAQCAQALNRTEAAVMDKWQHRNKWGENVQPPRQEKVWLDDIARVVCGVYGITKLDFVSPRRAVHMVNARQVFYWLARNFTSFSFPQIGAFCGRDHSTVIHGVEKIDEQIDRYRTKIELCVFDLGLSLPHQEAA